jgi:hypothetical protein
MNGYHSNNVASSSSNPYPDFSHLNQPTHPNPLPMQRQHQHQHQQHQHQQHQHQRHHQQQHHHPQQQHQQMHQMAQNQWPAGMRPNSHIPLQVPQQHQQFNHNQQAWTNEQLQTPQAFSNGIAPMGSFNMPYLSQQMIQDAFALSAPVEAADEKLLLQALLESRERRETYKDALNGLHGVSC